MSGGLADPIACTDDHHHATGKFFLGRHAPQFGILQQPVFDVEGFWRGKPWYSLMASAERITSMASEKNSAVTRLSLLFLPQATNPRPGIRMTVGFGSRMGGESGCLQAS